MSQNSSGSEWRKWDLHIHPPFTKLNNAYSIPSNTSGAEDNIEAVWGKYCQTLEESDVEVFGITDYFSLEGYKQFITKHQCLYPNSSKVFFPNIELRLSYSVNNETQNIHCHIIFNNDAETLLRADQFIANLPTTTTDNRGAHITCGQLTGSSQYQAVCIDLRDLKRALEEKFGTKTKPYLIVVACNGYGSNRASGSQRNAWLADEVDKFADMFFGSKDNVDFCLKKDRYEVQGNEAIPKAVLCGSDCHSFSDLEQNLSQQFSWIKGDKTFDGLSQVLFLPNPADRTEIKETPPVQPVIKISDVSLNVPDNAKIKSISTETRRTEVKPFFFAGKQWTFTLSPYFNCFIGGRGVGKSTLLNLIDERLNAKNKFFQENAPADFSVTASLSIDSGEEKYVEFFGQNEIEQYAKDAASLTKTVYTRIRSNAPEDVESAEEHLEKQLDIIDELIELIFQQNELSASLAQLTKDLGAKQNLQKVVQSEEYKNYSQQVKEIREKKTLIEQADQSFSALQGQLVVIQDSLTPFSEEEIERLGGQSGILTEYNAIAEKVSNLQEELQQIIEASTPADTIKSIDAQLQKVYDEVQGYLAGLGYSAENIKDMRNAVSDIQNIEKQLKTKNEQIERIKQRVRAYTYGELDAALHSYEDNIKAALEPIQRALSTFVANNPNNVAAISIDYIPHDIELVKKSIENEFKDHFSDTLNGVSRSDLIKDALFKIEPSDLLSEVKTQGDLLGALDSSATAYEKAIKQILTDKNNYEAYLMIIKKCFSNPMKHQRFSIKYDDKPLDQLSFGQRCTAAIILILATGNKPIIIDEPEAHLDSGLIADTLVDLIKVQKANRQIIFATHNANFVINADAEKIFILEEGENGVSITETTIENSTYRDKLMRLEGGKEALDKRFHRYNISTL